MTSPAVPEPSSAATTREGLGAVLDGWGRDLRPGSLGRRLVVQVALVVAAVAVAISLVTLVGVQRVFVAEVDDQVRAAAARQGRKPGNLGQVPQGAQFNNPIGTVLVQSSPGDRSRGHAVIVTEGAAGSVGELNAQVVQQLLEVPTDGRIHTIELEGLGSYRVLSASTQDQILVAGIPLTTVNSVLKSMALVEMAAVALAVGIAILVSAALVRRGLRPLNQLAETAHQVSTMPLDRGEVALAVRAPESDPRSEVGRVSLAFNHMLNNVESALTSRHTSETKVRQFVADASHELRNPLAAIRGYAELTRRDRDHLPEPAAFAIDRIDSESHRMSRLVEDMLLLARLDNDPDLATEPCDVSEIVLNAVSDARVAGPRHQWRVQLPDTPQLAQADPHRLAQVVVNLLSNARKHTPAGTTVTTTVTPVPEGVLVSVADDGPGIDPQMLPTVFERFARADTARSHAEEPSTGLGLAIVAAVMAAHGGTVGVQSTPGNTVFSLVFPGVGRQPQQ